MTIQPVEITPVQPRDSFVCPAWCVLEHEESDLFEWEYGQWMVQHRGQVATWQTSRGTQMTAQLLWAEIVGSSPIVGRDDGESPYIDLDGDDGSSYAGANHVVVQDVAEWTRVLNDLARQAELGAVVPERAVIAR